MKKLTIDDGIRVLAGTMVLLSVVLTLVFSRWWLVMTVFVAINLIQSAFTGICPAVKILKKIIKE